MASKDGTSWSTKPTQITEHVSGSKALKDLKLMCSVCAEANATKLPHNTARERATRSLELVHIDVGGPIADFIKQYLTESENKLGLKAAKIRCDNGGEFLSIGLKGW